MSEKSQNLNTHSSRAITCSNLPSQGMHTVVQEDAMRCCMSHWWVTSARLSWLCPHPRNWRLVPCQLTLLPSVPSLTLGWLSFSREPHPSRPRCLFLLGSAVLAPENTEPSLLGVPPYSFPCDWFLSLSPLSKVTNSLNQRKAQGCPINRDLGATDTEMQALASE